jgi:hypothetical protein
VPPFDERAPRSPPHERGASEAPRKPATQVLFLEKRVGEGAEHGDAEVPAASASGDEAVDASGTRDRRCRLLGRGRNPMGLKRKSRGDGLRFGGPLVGAFYRWT